MKRVNPHPVRVLRVLGLTAGLLVGCATTQAPPQAAAPPPEQLQQQPRQSVASPNPRPGQPGHRGHEEWQGSYPSLESQKAFKVINVLRPPDGFLGHMAYDRQSNRLWLITMGRPTTPDGSKLYELDPKTGAVLARADMPFPADLSSPIYLAGSIYQGVYHESKMYKVSVDRKDFGKITRVIDLPGLADLKLTDEAHPVPFIEFGGVAPAPGENIVFHADDVGEFITVERESGKLLHRVRTLKAIGGITSVERKNGQFLVLGNSDPRGSYCALAYPPAVSRSPEQKDISWALLDGKTGGVLASIRRQNSPAYASTVSLVDHQEVEGTPYGRFTFLAMGEEGILTLEWTPAKDAY